MAPDALAQVLCRLDGLFPPDQFPDLLVGLGPGDDAAVYRLTDDNALVATLDFFTPVVDDPYQYGAIAAANALSDVYAMGGRAILALNICCFPKTLEPDTIVQILRGGADKVAEAGAVLVGGHTVDDNEPKYGIVAIGFAHPDRILTKIGAQPGDKLVLSKPLGVGIITTALKREKASSDHIEAAIESMLRLNATAAQIYVDCGVRTCTDVTGFALVGHALEIATKSNVTLRFDTRAVPFLPGAHDYARQALFPGGTKRNKTAYSACVAFDGVSEEVQSLLYTPETSGGLLGAVPADRLDELLGRFDDAGHPVWVVGDVLPPAPGGNLRFA